ncbi:7-cyano-7-deazaguanine/7-aminomethyl-7-deazaguanine transporter [Sansalvadorimonas verongulae]|uniref:7-cyano-7-deazaguanine/7-aminomethyl-7- deazaguanine transporter n=1 Tax=Sansalvadorimonas verongulae TaxID=2172824 RepID=UPI0012BCA32E|nr:7-cyano-7-deazaguanine/7-aminomethyl-7-deazaguanine transporter [Sansalvadorimonas verongulae]MTI13514.1 7-cyano-7-deazaguanine/7-aminomethyl-7-deazaguanine transporter [Sansalvadorimonas verongulae]
MQQIDLSSLSKSTSSDDNKRLIILLSLFHIVIITASNYLVQIPFQMFGLHTTWGAFTFPFVFLATDLTVRIFGRALAQQIILRAMMPALVVSYLVSVMFYQGQYQPDGINSFNLFVARIAFASFSSYLIGQMLDITIFNRLRQLQAWWIAPAASTIMGNLIDTISFFSIAFYKSSDAFMSTHWLEIAMVDYGWKMAISMALFLPLYGVLLNRLQAFIMKNTGRQLSQEPRENLASSAS